MSARGGRDVVFVERYYARASAWNRWQRSDEFEQGGGGTRWASAGRLPKEPRFDKVVEFRNTPAVVAKRKVVEALNKLRAKVGLDSLPVEGSS